ncbi:hypothetical protein PRIPAC_73616 [Pristionchus pacificus]|uniref:Trypsin n=1 Tax=Pristionchus pacificus TaxID=54126 RepID=A0A2A6BR92_PRIPA|nr:hypothetical protein PRIPAC_73616 [Pristionchus pacificus]|eukprot:PDM68430.1 Trypsin [Pristionchus pacificus]
MRTLVLCLVVLVAAAAATSQCGQVKKNPVSAAILNSPEVEAVIRAKRGANQTGEAILGGQYASSGSWPWTVSICLLDWFGNCNFKTAGTIISDLYVVSSYYDLNHGDKDTSYHVRAGSTNWNSGGQFVQVEFIYYITDYDSKSHYDDITVIKLGFPLTFNDYVQPICLTSNDAGMIDAGDKAWFNGWGHTSGSIFATQPKEMVQANFPIDSNGLCQNKYKNYNTKTMLCAGGESTTACNWDAGGPLMREKNGIWYLIGVEVTSNDFGSCESATVFTRASQYCWFFSKNAGVSCT